MKTPPFLLLAALLFWGWQADFLVIGGCLGVLLESAQFLRARWDLDDADFNRIWSFCVLLVVASAGYVFTTNDGGAGGLFHGDHAARNAINSAALTTTRFLRWLPLATFPFIAAQIFNTRPTVPLTAVSLVLRWRRRMGDRAFAGHYLDISYPYFILCLFSAGIHTNTGSQTYFFGECVLIAWALGAIRSPRLGISIWLGAFVLAAGLGLLGDFGINLGQREIQNFNAQWMARFFHQQTDPTQSITAIGQIGELKLSDQIVIWLEPAAMGRVPSYLREASYRKYGALNQTWYAGLTGNDFEHIPAEANGTSWVLRAGQTNTAAVNIACYLNGWSRELEAPEGLLPLPSGSHRLDNIPAEMLLKKNQTGAVLAAGRGLVIFDAHYGPGATLDSPPNFGTNSDLIVPAEEKPALNQVLSEINLTATNSEFSKLLVLQKFFDGKFVYRMWQGADKKATTNASPLTRFLLTSRSGHCEYFATATVLLLRELGIPARYAVGYAVHETSGTGFIIRERDAHAWCLAWNATTQSWEDFDTTPPSWVAIESRHAAWLERLSDLKSWLGFQIAKFRWRQAQLQQYIFWALVPVMVVLLYHIVFRHRKRTRTDLGQKNLRLPDIWPGVDSEFYLLERQLAALGVLRQPSEPLADWLERALTAPGLAQLRAPVQTLLHLHYRLRFDPRGLNPAERECLKQQTNNCVNSLLPPKP